MTDHKSDHSESGDRKDAGTSLGFGSLLRSAREEAGYSIERVAMATRISPPFIEALENEQFEKLPGDMFGRGFLRNLCKAYGKPSEPLLAALEASLQNARGRIEISHQSDRDEKRHQQLKKGVLSIQPKEWQKHIRAWAPHHYIQAKPLAAIAGVMLLGVVIVKIWPSSQEGGTSFENSAVSQRSREPALVPPPAPAPLPVAVPAAVPTVPAQAVNLDAKATDAASTGAKPQGEAAPVGELPADGQAMVELRVKEPTNVTINKDQDKQTIEQLKVQTYRFAFDQQFRLYVENPAAVEIYFKGQRIGANAPKGEPKRFTFSSAPAEIAKKEQAPKL